MHSPTWRARLISVIASTTISQSAPPPKVLISGILSVPVSYTDIGIIASILMLIFFLLELMTLQSVLGLQHGFTPTTTLRTFKTSC